MTGITADGIEIDREFSAPPAEVFAAFTLPEHFARWFGGKDVFVPAERLTFDAVEGREWRATMVLPDGNTIDWAGAFVEVSPVNRLVLTMTDQPTDPARATVAIDLSPTGSGTRMRMSQTTPDFPDAAREALLAGWQSFFDEIESIVLND
jgi:uncharacterized protein YndB with AHSA1/START domain